MSRGRLDVYLGDELLGQLEDRTLGYVAFVFAPEAIARHGFGARLLSVNLPVTQEPTDVMTTTPFFAGLLPEGGAGERLATEFQLGSGDTFGLLAAIGRESAGALTIVPEGETPPAPSRASPEPLSEEAASRRRWQRLALAPLGVTVEDDEVRLSLAGVQDKLPLVQVDGGRLARPGRGQPSTLIAKPAHTRFPELVANEAFCLAATAELGLPTSSFRVLPVAGEPVLLVERYDRALADDRHVVRLHQEDVCQATGVNPGFKYQANGGPSLADVAALLDEHSSRPGIDRRTLFRLTVVNALLGNCDAHGKNLSLLHTTEGVQLAPAYDIVSTAAYPAHTDRLGMYIGAATRLRHVDRAALEQEAATLRIPHRLSDRLLHEIADALPGALATVEVRAAQEGWQTDMSNEISLQTRERAARMLLW